MGGSTGYAVFNPSSSSVKLISFSINNISAIDLNLAQPPVALSPTHLMVPIPLQFTSRSAQPKSLIILFLLATQLSRKLNRTYYRMDLLPWFGNMKDQMEMNQTLSTFNLT